MVRCGQCQKELKLITGHSTIRLYRCDGCGAQQMLPGDASPAAAVAAVAETVTESGARVDDPIGAAAALIAANPTQGKKLPPMVVMALIAIALGILWMVVF